MSDASYGTLASSTFVGQRNATKPIAQLCSFGYVEASAFKALEEATNCYRMRLLRSLQKRKESILIANPVEYQEKSRYRRKGSVSLDDKNVRRSKAPFVERQCCIAFGGDVEINDSNI